MKHVGLILVSLLLFGAPELLGAPLTPSVKVAAKGKGKRGKRSPPRSVTKEKSPEKAPAKETAKELAPSSEPGPSPDDDAVTLLTRARTLYEALEYDRVMPFAEAALAREDITLEQKLDAYLLLGSSMAIVGDPIEAEKPFRLLLRARTDFDLPPTTPPKILAVFRKVQVEERAIATQLEELQRRRVISSLKFSGETPDDAQGGRPLRFSFHLKDPLGAVEGVRLAYRRQGEREFSSLPLERGDEGSWSGNIPGEWTANADGFVLEFFVAAIDARGPLATLGAEAAPLTTTVTPGTFDVSAPPPVPLWVFGTAASSTAVLALAGGSLGLGMMLLQNDYRTVAGSSELIDGAELSRMRQLGDGLALSANIGFAAAAAGALVTGVLSPFVNWTGREALAPE